jgi:hypothetical protein
VQPKAAPAKTIGAVRRERAARPAAPPDPEPEPDEPPPASADADPATDVVSVDIDDLILAWSELLTVLPPATRAAAQEAQPLSITDDVITFGVAPNMLANARPRFQKEADTIRDALSTRVGRRMKFLIVAHDGFDARPDQWAAPAQPPVLDEPAEEEIDLADLVDGDGADVAVDSVSIIAKRLDATVVEEHPRA